MKALEFILSFLAKVWFQLTKYFPRKLPTTVEELDRVKYVMVHYLGLELSDGVWYTVLSHMMAGKPTSLRKSYGSMVNAAAKLKVSKLTQDQKTIEHQAYLDKLKETTERIANEFKRETEVTGTHNDHADVQDWSHSLAGEMQSLPVTPQ